MQQDDLRWITLLNPILEFDVSLSGPVPKLCGQRETLTSVPAKALIPRDRVDHNEFGAAMFTERKRILESTTPPASRSRLLREREKIESRCCLQRAWW